MKKYLFAALAAFALLAISCDKDENGNVSQSDLLCTWYMPGEEYHPSIVTFEKNGNYTWEYGGITGMKDTGTYSISGDVITFKISTFWEIETDWVDGHPANIGEWKKVTDERINDLPRTRTATVHVLAKPLLIWSIKNDWFYGGGEEDGAFLMFMSSNKDEMKLDKPVTESDLQGEWEYKDDNGKLQGRLIAKGNKFTAYSLGTAYHSDATGTEEPTIHYYVTKEVGTFSVNGNEFTVNYETMYSSAKYDLVDGVWVNEYAEFDANTLEAKEWLTEQPMGYSDIYIVYRDGANLYWGYGRGGAAFKKK